MASDGLVERLTLSRLGDGSLGLALLRRVPLLLTALANLLERLARKVLPEHALDDLLLPRPAPADADQDPGGDVHGDGDAEDGGRDGRRSRLIVDAPGRGAEGDLQGRVQVEEEHDGEKEALRERVVRLCLVRAVEGVRFGELGLVVDERGLLGLGQDGYLVTGGFELRIGGQVVLVPQLGHLQLLPQLPRLAVVVRDEGHVVGIDDSEGGEAVSDDGEEGYEHVVDDVDDV